MVKAKLSIKKLLQRWDNGVRDKFENQKLFPAPFTPKDVVSFGYARQACLREIKEELNIDTPLDKLLCVEHLSDDTQQTEGVQFIFYGGLIPASQLPSIVLPVPELSEYRFSTRDEALQLLSCKLARRLPYCL